MRIKSNNKCSRFSFRLSHFTFHILACSIIAISLSGCISTDEITILKSNIISISNNLNQYKDETNIKLLAIEKEQENLKKQLIGVSTSIENRDDKNRTLLGRVEELDHQLQTYWKDTRTEINALKTGNVKPPAIDQPQEVPVKEIDPGTRYWIEDKFIAFGHLFYGVLYGKFTGHVDADRMLGFYK